MKKVIIWGLLTVLSPDSFANKMAITVLANKVYRMIRSPTQSAAFSTELLNLLRLPPSTRLKDLHEKDFYALFRSQESIADSVRIHLAQNYGWSVHIDENALYGPSDAGQEIVAATEGMEYSTILFNPDGTTNPSYANMDGQAKYADEHYGEEMGTAYNAVHATQKRKSTYNRVAMPTNWHLFQGSTTAYHRIKQTLIDFFAGQIDLNDVATLLKEELFENIILVLEYGDPSFNRHLAPEIAKSYIKEHLLDKTGTVREEYKHPQGLQHLARRYFSGEEDRAYQLAETHLGDELFKQLEWKQQPKIDEDTPNQDLTLHPSDHTDGGQKNLAAMEGMEHLAILFNPNGTTNPSYANMDGQAKLASEHYNGEMDTAYNAVHKNNTVTMPTNWHLFQGPTTAYYRIKQTLLDFFGAQIDLNDVAELLKEDLLENIILVLNYGHPLFNRHFASEIAKYYIREHLLDETGSVREEYKHPQGLQHLTRHYFLGKEDKAYQLAKTHLGDKLFKQLEWKRQAEIDEDTLVDTTNPDDGPTDREQKTLAAMEGREYLTILFNPDGTTNPLYANMDGQAKYADEHYNEEMGEAFKAVYTSQEKKSTNNRVIMPTNWHLFHGSTTAYYRIKQTLLDFFGGQIDLNDVAELLKEDLFVNVIPVLRYGDPLFNRHFTHEIARSYIREHLLDEAGTIRERYKYLQGLQDLAHHYFLGEEYKVYQLAEAHLDSKLFKQLEWEEHLEVISRGPQYYFEERPGTYHNLNVGDIIMYATTGRVYTVFNIEVAPGTSGQPEDRRIFLRNADDAPKIEGYVYYNSNWDSSNLFVPFTVIGHNRSIQKIGPLHAVKPVWDDGPQRPLSEVSPGIQYDYEERTGLSYKDLDIGDVIATLDVHGRVFVVFNIEVEVTPGSSSQPETRRIFLRSVDDGPRVEAYMDYNHFVPFEVIGRDESVQEIEILEEAYSMN